MIAGNDVSMGALAGKTPPGVPNDSIWSKNIETFTKVLTGAKLEEAKKGFHAMLKSIDYDVTAGHDVLYVREFLEPYLGRTDACLIATYLSTGHKVNFGSGITPLTFFSPLADVLLTNEKTDTPVVQWGTASWHAGFMRGPKRYVDDAIENSEHVFQNYKPIITFIKNHGSLKEAKTKADVSQKERNENIDMAEKGKKWAESYLNILAFTTKTLPIIAGVLVLYLVYRNLKSVETVVKHKAKEINFDKEVFKKKAKA